MTTRSHDLDGTPGSLAGDLSVPLGPSSGRSAVVIPFPSRVAAASMAWVEESSDDQWEDLGTLAVSLVADWQLPRLLVFAQVLAGGHQDLL